jgi:DNA replication protein DnaC
MDFKIMKPLMLRSFSKTFPELATAQNVDVKEGVCPSCNEKQLWLFTYEIDGKAFERACFNKCNVCDTKALEVKTTQHFVEKRINQLNDNWYIIGPNEGKFGFKNYLRETELHEKAYKQAAKFVADVSQNNKTDEFNLLMQGSTGAGKTHLVKAIARTLKARDFKVGFVTSEELFSKFKRTFGQIDPEGLQQRIYSEMASLDVLVIDDIGTEANKIVEDTSWAGNTWTKIIDCRSGKFNVWTTNHDEEQLFKVVGHRAFSRMYEGTRFVNLFTDDFRKTKAVKE